MAGRPDGWLGALDIHDFWDRIGLPGQIAAIVFWLDVIGIILIWLIYEARR